MTSKKDKFKAKVSKAVATPADILFNDVEKTEDVQTNMPAKPAKKRVDKKPTVERIGHTERTERTVQTEIKHRKDVRVKETYARVNLYIPPELKEDSTILSELMGMSLTNLIIKKLEESTESNRDAIQNAKKLRGIYNAN